jgi:uncharacterized membrane protein YkvI
MNHFSSLYAARTNLFLVILPSIILVIFNTQIHSLFAEEQNLTDPLSLQFLFRTRKKIIFTKMVKL